MPSLPLSEDATGPRLTHWLPSLAVFGCGALVFVLPLIFPLGIARDFPNHLARVFIQYRLDQDPLLAANYVLEWRLIPHLAMDLFAVPFAGWLSPYLIGGLFNGLTLLLLFSAGVALQRRHAGAISLWALLPLVFVFNEALRWGFMNFLFSVGLALWVVYFWLGGGPVSRWQRLVLFAAAQLALFFAHLLGFLFCGYLILVLELHRAWRERRQGVARCLSVFVRHMTPFIAPLLLFAYVLLFHGSVGGAETSYGNVGTKATAFWSPTSALAVPAGPVILVVSLLLVYSLLRRRLAVIDGQLKPLLWAMLVLVIAMPSKNLGIWGLDFRFPAVALILLVAAVRPSSSLGGTALLNAVLAALVGTALLAGGLAMAGKDRELQAIRQALQQAEPGGALLVAGGYDPVCRGCYPAWADYLHSGSLAVIERSMFVPMLFTATSPVAAAPARVNLDVPYGWPPSEEVLRDDRHRSLDEPLRQHDPDHRYWHGWPKHFDYLLWLRQNGTELHGLEELEKVTEGRLFVLYRITAPAATGGSGR